MLDYLEGEIVDLHEDRLVLAVNGVGYRLAISKATAQNLHARQGLIKIYSQLHLTQNELALYGFATSLERELFQLLITVSGVGPKGAMGILSSTTPERFAQAISSGRRDLLEEIKGVGRKTAERLIVELKEKIAKLPISAGPITSAREALHEELALRALTRTLGFSETEARRALAKAKAAGATTTEELVKKALTLLS